MQFKHHIIALALLYITTSVHLHLQAQNQPIQTPTQQRNITAVCPSHSQYNATTGSCDCISGTVINQNKTLCVCPSEAPYFS